MAGFELIETVIVTLGFEGTVDGGVYIAPHASGERVPAPCSCHVSGPLMMLTRAVVKFIVAPAQAVPVLVPVGSVAVSCNTETAICIVPLVPPPGAGLCACSDTLPDAPLGKLTFAVIE